MVSKGGVSEVVDHAGRGSDAMERGRGCKAVGPTGGREIEASDRARLEHTS